jgi:ribose transport system permease protein
MNASAPPSTKAKGSAQPSGAEPRTSAKQALREGNPQGMVEVLARLRLGRFSGLFLWAAIIVVFAIWVPDTFLTSTTLKSILSTQAITGVLAIAVLFPLAVGAFDLSAAQNMGLSALVCGSLMTHGPHLSPATAIVLTIAMSMAIGAFNGILVAGIGISSFIATLGTSSLLLATGAVIGHGSYVGPFPESFASLTDKEVLGIPIVAIYLLVFATLSWYVLARTPIGRRAYATGANADAARLAGVRTGRSVFGGMVACGFGAGIAGVMLASSTNAVNETLGPAYLLPAYAAAFLGSTQLVPGRFNVWGTVLAIYLLGTGVSGLQLVGGSLWVTDYFNGVALIGAVGTAVLIDKYRGRREKARTAKQNDE